MSDADFSASSEEMLQLHARYRARLLERRNQMAPLLSAVESNTLTPEARAELKSHAHKLAGSGATFGYPVISEIGIQLENHLAQPELEPIPLAALLRQMLHAIDTLEP